MEWIHSTNSLFFSKQDGEANFHLEKRHDMPAQEAMMTTVRSSLRPKRNPTEHGVDSFRGAQKSSPGVGLRSRDRGAME